MVGRMLDEEVYLMYNNDTDWEGNSCFNTEPEWEFISSEEPCQVDNMKVPMIIGEFTVQIDVESRIKLPEPALEIKRIKKNVFLTQCKPVTGTKKVFLEGLIRKNIEYATIDCITPKAISGDIKHTTVHVPFKCSTEVKCMIPSELNPNYMSREIKYYDEESHGADMKEQDLISEEWFNEKIYCELQHSKIYEADIIDDAKKIEHHPIEQEFQTFTEKEVIYLTLTLLKKQQLSQGYEISEDSCSH